VQIQNIAILHIDADWYESVKLCLERFYDHIQPGGFVVIDDYSYWDGCKRATDEFLKERLLDITPIKMGYVSCCFQKPYKPLEE